jgi:hypothetical protein
MANTITYTINLDGNVTQGVLNLQGAANRTVSAVDKLRDRINVLANAGFAIQHVANTIGKVTAAVSSCVSAYENQVVAVKKLETVMRNTMGAGAAEVEMIKELTSAQQKLGVIGDEVQLSGAQELATYLEKTESLKGLIPVMNDMLAQQYGLNASQEQAQNIGMMLGKVMQGQTGALSRYGYKFDEVQEKILKTGNESQRLAVLTNVVNGAVGGVNAALATTPEGKWKQHQNAMGDLMEQIGKLAVEVRGALAPVFEAVGGVVEKIVGLFEANRESIMGFASVIGNALGGIFNAVGTTIVFIVEHWKILLGIGWAWLTWLTIANWEWIKFAVTYHTKITLMDKLTKIWTVTCKGLKMVFDTLSRHPWMLAISVAIGLTVMAVRAFKKFREEQNAVRDAVSGVTANIGLEQNKLNGLFEALKKTNPESKERKSLIEQINEKYPGLLGNLNLEKAAIDKITEAQNAANKALGQNLFLKNYAEKRGAAETAIDAAKMDLFTALSQKGFKTDVINMVIGKIEEQALSNRSGLGLEILIPRQGRTPLKRAIDKHDEANTFFDVFRRQHKILSALEAYGTGHYGVTQDMLLSAVNSPLVPGFAGGGKPTGGGDLTGGANEAIATGGKRNTTINISIGDLIREVNFNGGFDENRDGVQRGLAQAIMQVLGMAETAAG